MNDFSMATTACTIQIALALLYVSGTTDSATRGRAGPTGEILENPFQIAALASTVRSAPDMMEEAQT
jgi:hypothetical protein